MGKPTGFIELPRAYQHKRPIAERVRDWREVTLPTPETQLRQQAGRCMDCGVPFCNQGCPLGNLVPEWNDLAYRGRWREAYERLAATNNFPEWTGRLCPAPCENACVLAIDEPDHAVTIKSLEMAIIERAFDEGWVMAHPPAARTGRRVAVVGSGPAGLAVADQLNRAGHAVTVYERSDRLGGLLRYGIPEFKMEKRFLDRRLALLAEEGVIFQTNADVGENVPVSELRAKFDAIVLAAGALWGRGLADDLPGRDLRGIHQAMDYLTVANRVCQGEYIPPHEMISAAGKQVIILGGGDTGADCLGTAVRQGAASIRQWDYNSPPPPRRPANNPWPEWARVRRDYSAHQEADALYGDRLTPRVGVPLPSEEALHSAHPVGHNADVSDTPCWPAALTPPDAIPVGHGPAPASSARNGQHGNGHANGNGHGVREYQVFTAGFEDNGQGAVAAVHGFRGRWTRLPDGSRQLQREPDSEFRVPADLVLLAIGFRGTQRTAMLTELGVRLDGRGNAVVGPDFTTGDSTGAPPVFAVGDMTRGASLIVWAIADARRVAREVDRRLMGHSNLPTPEWRGDLVV